MPKWRVIGPRSFQGVAPGEEFWAELTDAQAQRALSRHSIELVSDSMPKLDRKRVSPPDSEEPAEPSPLTDEPETEDQ